jgi:hypothetical protein
MARIIASFTPMLDFARCSGWSHLLDQTYSGDDNDHNGNSTARGYLLADLVEKIPSRANRRENVRWFH